MRGFGRIYRRRRSASWWIEYWHRGRQFRESSGSARKSAARGLLKRRLQEIGRGRFVGPSEERVLLTDLLDAVTVDYELNRRRSLGTLPSRLAPLRTVFAGERAIDVSEDRIERYKARRLAEGYATATLNRELAALRRAFRLGVLRKRISTAPTITLLAEHNIRQGFAEPATFEQVVANLGDADLEDFCRFAYLSGWRKGELQTLAWSDVDRGRGRITLRREHSKSGEPRELPLTPALAAIIERRWRKRTVKGRDGTTRVVDLVFHRAGRPIGDFRKTWHAACRAAGVPNLLFHDLRRSAVRNMTRSGVDPVVAMRVTGHQTDAVYRRYQITTDADVREALLKTEAAVARDGRRKIVSLHGRRGRRS